MTEIKIGDLILAEIPESVADELIRLSEQTPGRLANNIELSMGEHQTRKDYLSDSHLYHVLAHTEIRVTIDLVFYKKHLGKRLYDDREERK